MPITNKQKEKISIEVIKTLISRFDSFPADSSSNRNAPFHEAFLNAFDDKLDGKVPNIPFFISLSSWLHGLNTTLGQTFFEKIAHHLCEGEKREYTSKRLGNLQIRQSQRNHVAQIIADLSNATSTPNVRYEEDLLFVHYKDDLINAMDFSADVFFEDAANVIAIELKSVRPNAGEMKGEKQKILEGKAALFNYFPDKQIQFFIGFPFDPTVDPASEKVTSHDKSRFLNSIVNMNKYFAKNESLIASDLWDFLSGQQNTMEEILDIINTISTTSFLKEFQLLSNSENRTSNEYLSQLTKWNLFSEIELCYNNETILQKIANDRTLSKIYHKNSFDGKGNYSWDRYHELRRLF